MQSTIERVSICQVNDNIFLLNNHVLIAYVILIVDRDAKLDGHIIIGTPATVLDWFSKLQVFDIKKIGVFVLDQADMMIARQGHRDQCIRIHKYVLQIDSVCLFILIDYELLLRTENCHWTAK